MTITSLWTVKRKRPELLVYWNESLWLISFSLEWSWVWQTMADKNVWAVEVWNDWDEITFENTWNIFQWWNNHPFPARTLEDSEKDRIEIDVTWVEPSTYSREIFYYNPYPYKWDINSIRDLWWFITWTNEARRWPCPEWFHVPERSEVEVILDYNAMKRMKISQWHQIQCSDWKYFKWSDRNPYYFYLCDSTKSEPWFWEQIMHFWYQNPNHPSAWFYRYWHWYWYPVRPFKNEPVVPDLQSWDWVAL